MNQLSTAANLDELLHHRGWLLEQLAENAKAYLTMLEQLTTLEQESDAYAALEGRLYAQAAQLEMSAGDVVKVMDELTDALPEDGDQ